MSAKIVSLVLSISAIAFSCGEMGTGEKDAKGPNDPPASPTPVASKAVTKKEINSDPVKVGGKPPVSSSSQTPSSTRVSGQLDSLALGATEVRVTVDAEGDPCLLPNGTYAPAGEVVLFPRHKMLGVVGTHVGVFLATCMGEKANLSDRPAAKGMRVLPSWWNMGYLPWPTTSDEIRKITPKSWRLFATGFKILPYPSTPPREEGLQIFGLAGHSGEVSFSCDTETGPAPASSDGEKTCRFLEANGSYSHSVSLHSVDLPGLTAQLHVAYRMETVSIPLRVWKISQPAQ